MKTVKGFWEWFRLKHFNTLVCHYPINQKYLKDVVYRVLEDRRDDLKAHITNLLGKNKTDTAWGKGYKSALKDLLKELNR